MSKLTVKYCAYYFCLFYYILWFDLTKTFVKYRKASIFTTSIEPSSLSVPSCQALVTVTALSARTISKRFLLMGKVSIQVDLVVAASLPVVRDSSLRYQLFAKPIMT
jgi:hypothetical protein